MWEKLSEMISSRLIGGGDEVKGGEGGSKCSKGRELTCVSDSYPPFN